MVSRGDGMLGLEVETYIVYVLVIILEENKVSVDGIIVGLALDDTGGA